MDIFAIIECMRIISGLYGGHRLKTLAGNHTRPTSDKVRGAIFNMLAPVLVGGGVALDLYAGSGAMAIEAVSRGMKGAVLVEKNQKAQMVIEQNIQMTREKEKFHLLKMAASQALDSMTTSFDLVFLDPPYAKEQVKEDMTQLQERGLLSREALVVCETEKSTDLPEEMAGFTIWKQKIYGISKVTIYGR